MTRTSREKRRVRGPLAFAVGFAGALLFHGPQARAFCRSTTCRSTAAHECVLDDDGCPAEGAKLFWPTSCVSYATNKLGTSRFDPEDTRAVIRKAFEAWSAVDCPDGTVAAMTFQERDPVSCHKSQYNSKGPNVNLVFFEDTMWRYKGTDFTLAKTAVTYSDDTGEIFDADIEINAAHVNLTITDDLPEVDTDLQSVVTHEAGHFIGLAHSPDYDAVMFASYGGHSTSQRYLSTDDVAAVCAVYPADNGLACKPEPHGGFSGTCDDPAKVAQCTAQPGTATASFGALVLFGCAGLVGVRSRRRAAHAYRPTSSGERR
jgi:hypothetical protein